MDKCLQVVKNLSKKDEELLRNACINGKLKFIKLLLKIKPNINLSIWNERPFCNACQFGHLHIAKYLLKIKPDIDISTDNEYAFSYACHQGHLKIVKWLLKIKPNIDVTIDDCWAFEWACKNNHVEVCKFLYSLMPCRYILRLRKNKIVKWHIKETLKILEGVTVLQIENCPICHYERSNIITKCNHQYCYECLNIMFSSTNDLKCPLCRNDIKFCNSI